MRCACCPDSPGVPREPCRTAELDASTLTLSCAASDAPSLRQLLGGEFRRAGDGGGEPAGIIARRDRPGILRGIELGDDADVRRREAENIGHDLRQHRAMALPLRHRGDVHGDRADRIERDRRGRLSAVLGSGLAALVRRQHRGDVAHVGDAGLDHGRIADAVETAFGARRIAPRLKFGKSPSPHRRSKAAG